MANHLGEFLRARPADVGLPSGLGPRRTPGPRRRGAGRRGRAEHRLRHPQVGEFALTTEVLYLEEGQRMTIYQAKPGTRDHDAMTLPSMVTSTPSRP